MQIILKFNKLLNMIDQSREAFAISKDLVCSTMCGVLLFFIYIIYWKNLLKGVNISFYSEISVPFYFDLQG